MSKRDGLQGNRETCSGCRRALQGGNSEVSKRDEVPGKLVAVAEGVKLREICGNLVSILSSLLSCALHFVHNVFIWSLFVSR